MSCHRKEEGERVSGHTRKLDLVLDGPAIVVLAGRRTQIAPHAGGANHRGCSGQVRDITSMKPSHKG